jgi:2-polyprenyl-3-methyl-5-hydroxy-6-metoxy-1,4-benzoquinol methylase
MDLYDENKKRFEALASTWDANPEYLQRSQAIAKAIQEAIPLYQGMDALECGASSGELSILLAPFLKHVLATDFSTNMIAIIQEKCKRLQVHNVSAKLFDPMHDTLPEQFDLLFSSMLLHHIPDTLAFFQRCHPWLKPKGYLAVADLDREDGSFHQDHTGVAHFGFDRNEVKALLKEAGFSMHSEQTVYIIRKNNRDYPIFLLIAQKD